MRAAPEAATPAPVDQAAAVDRGLVGEGGLVPAVVVVDRGGGVGRLGRV